MARTAGKQVNSIFYEMVLSINNSFCPAAREQIKCPMGNNPWRMPSQNKQGPLSHTMSSFEVGAGRWGERTESRGGVTESMVLCCLSEG